MPWAHRTIIVPAPYAAAASAACEHLAGAGGSGMYTTPLSPTGELPATHWISSGLIEQAFADLLASPDALTAVATQAGLDPAPRDRRRFRHHRRARRRGARPPRAAALPGALVSA